MSRINQAARAFLAWNVLVEIASGREKLTYGELGKRIGIHHRAIRYVLGPIQQYCMEERNLPPLTILVTDQQGRTGSGFIARERDDLESGFTEVWNFPWLSIPNPFDFGAEGSSYDCLLAILTDDPDNSEDVYVKVKSRGIKHILFRDAVRRAYGNVCAFSGLHFFEALDACHIVPWNEATPQQRMDVRNGLLLNPLHHRLFDQAYITIDSRYNIIYSDPDGLERAHSAPTVAMTIALHGKRMNLPRLEKHRPLLKNIAQHNKLFEWEVE